MDFSREELSNRLLQEFIQEDSDLPEREFGWNIKVMVPLIALAVLGFIFFAWHSDKIAISRNVGSEVPLVKADTTPIREKPDDPGGMYIANRDKQVYEAIASGNGEKELPKVIRVLPEPEEPISREIIKGDATVAELIDEAKESSKAEEIPADTPSKKEAEPLPKVAVAANIANKEVVVKQELMSKDIEVETDEKPPVDAVKAADPVDPKALTVNNIRVVPVPKNKVDNEPAAKKLDSSYKIQLGSFRSEADVKTTWNKIKKEHSELFLGTDLVTQKANLGEKGVFYRLQVANIKKESDARKICQKLIENKQGCFVVKK
jgi:cell division septation protein DedD